MRVRMVVLGKEQEEYYNTTRKENQKVKIPYVGLGDEKGMGPIFH